MYPKIYQSLFHEPWLIDPIAHQSMQKTLIARINSTEGIMPQKADMREKERLNSNGEKVREYKMIGDVAHISVTGVLGKKLSMMESMCGGFDMNKLADMVKMAADDEKVKSIVIDMDSPGGTVTGTYETAMMIAEAAKVKPVYGFTEKVAASAAYWLLSQCTHIFTTPSAMLGSIGVYMAFMKGGEDMELIKSGKFKAMGLKELTEEERDLLQERVTDTHLKFKKEVSAKRPVTDDIMEGLTYTGEQSIENGLADSLVMNFDEMMSLIN